MGEGQHRRRRVTRPAISDRVLAAVAEEEEEPLVEADERLYEVVDPDALNQLLEDAPADLTVRFTFLGYPILVRGDGTVTVPAH